MEVFMLKNKMLLLSAMLLVTSGVNAHGADGSAATMPEIPGRQPAPKEAIQEPTQDGIERLLERLEALSLRAKKRALEAEKLRLTKKQLKKEAQRRTRNRRLKAAGLISAAIIAGTAAYALHSPEAYEANKDWLIDYLQAKHSEFNRVAPRIATYLASTDVAQVAQAAAIGAQDAAMRAYAALPVMPELTAVRQSVWNAIASISKHTSFLLPLV
jgi:hypothetical protein